MKIRIISISDGYHEPDFYFEDGRCVYDEEELYKILLAPHEEHYTISKIWFDDIDEDESPEDFSFVGNYDDDVPHNTENFEKLYKIYKKIYDED